MPFLYLDFKLSTKNEQKEDNVCQYYRKLKRYKNKEFLLKHCRKVRKNEDKMF